MKIRWPFISYKRDQDMSDEMAFHLESKTRELVSGGMNEADARLEARRRFGSVLKQKEAGHEIRTGHFFENVLRDARHMGRGLRRSPGFTIAVVLTLALGIGANTAIFSIVDQVLLRPLPYPEGDKPRDGVRERRRNSQNSVSPATWLDWQRDNRTLERVAAWADTICDILTGAGEASQVGVQPSLASSSRCFVSPRCSAARFQRDDDRPNAPVVAVISHHLWQTRFGGDANVIGRFIQLDDTPHQVIGVMPPGFRFVYSDIDVWVAAATRPECAHGARLTGASSTSSRE